MSIFAQLQLLSPECGIAGSTTRKMAWTETVAFLGSTWRRQIIPPYQRDCSDALRIRNTRKPAIVFATIPEYGVLVHLLSYCILAQLKSNILIWYSN